MQRDTFDRFCPYGKIGIRPRLYSDIDATEAVEKNHDVSLRVDEAQENSITFEEMGVSKRKLRSAVSRINWLRTLQWSLRNAEKIEKVAR
jgi:hypothetical protein